MIKCQHYSGLVFMLCCSFLIHILYNIVDASSPLMQNVVYLNSLSLMFGKRFKKLMMWEGVEEGKGLHLMDWAILGKPLYLGGLELRNLRLWCFSLESSSLWYKIIMSKYCLILLTQFRVRLKAYS